MAFARIKVIGNPKNIELIKSLPFNLSSVEVSGENAPSEITLKIDDLISKGQIKASDLISNLPKGVSLLTDRDRIIVDTTPLIDAPAVVEKRREEEMEMKKKKRKIREDVWDNTRKNVEEEKRLEKKEQNVKNNLDEAVKVETVSEAKQETSKDVSKTQSVKLEQEVETIRQPMPLEEFPIPAAPSEFPQQSEQLQSSQKLSRPSAPNSRPGLKPGSAKSAVNDVKKAKRVSSFLRGFGIIDWAPLVGFLVLFLVIFMVIGLSFGGAIGANAGEPTPSPVPQPEQGGGNPNPIDTGGGGTAPGTPISYDDFLKYFIFETSVTDQQKQYVYKLFTPALSSPTYVSLLTLKQTTPVHLYFYPNDGTLCANCISGGANYDNNTIKFWNFFASGLPDYNKQHILIHESVHIIDKRNDFTRSGPNAPYNKVYQSLISANPSCYDNNGPSANGSYYISTYPYRTGDTYTNGTQIGGTPQSESLADSAADNVSCGPGKSCDPNNYNHSKSIQNYPTTCQATYNWMRDNIFGGVDYFGLNGSTGAGAGTQAAVTPSPDQTCGGKYAVGTNFGDTACEFANSPGAARATLYTYLQNINGSTKTTLLNGTPAFDYDIWFNTVIPHESGFNPNMQSGATNGRAYGLYSMASLSEPHNGQYDNGNVPWRTQSDNAVNYNDKYLSATCKWQYWSTASCGQVVACNPNCRGNCNKTANGQYAASCH